jgi:hypothetical protein
MKKLNRPIASIVETSTVQPLTLLRVLDSSQRVVQSFSREIGTTSAMFISHIGRLVASMDDKYRIWHLQAFRDQKQDITIRLYTKITILKTKSMGLDSKQHVITHYSKNWEVST